jgi:hypothetical protein
MGDEGDDQLVDARVSGEGPARELGELAVVAARETLPYLADVLLDDVEVVEQPLARRSDVGVAVGGVGEPGVGVVEDAPRVVEAREQARAGPPARGEALLAGDGARALAQVLGAEQLAADGAREQVLRRSVSPEEQAGEEAGRRDRKSTGCHSQQDTVPLASRLPAEGQGGGRWTGRERGSMMSGMVDPFTIAAELLGDMQLLSRGQLAQLRALNSKYQQRVFELTLGGTRGLMEGEGSELEAMVRRDILAMLTSQQLRALEAGGLRKA